MSLEWDFSYKIFHFRTDFRQISLNKKHESVGEKGRVGRVIGNTYLFFLPNINLIFPEWILIEYEKTAAISQVDTNNNTYRLNI